MQLMKDSACPLKMQLMKTSAYPVKIAIFAFKLLVTMVRKRTP